jgi:hypothetical protein
VTEYETAEDKENGEEYCETAEEGEETVQEDSGATDIKRRKRRTRIMKCMRENENIE